MLEHARKQNLVIDRNASSLEKRSAAILTAPHRAGRYPPVTDPLQFISLSIIISFATAPINRSTAWPFLNSRSVGKERILNWAVTRVLRSTSNLPILIFPAKSTASCSITGAMIWHGPHQSAEKSARTGWSLSKTSRRKLSSVNVMQCCFVFMIAAR